MWILPKTIGPLLQWSSAQVTLASISDSSEQSRICASSLLVRSKPSPVRTWSQKWKRDSWSLHLSGRILRPSLDERFAAKWASLWPDTPVSPSAPPANDSELRTLDISGLTCESRSSSCGQNSASLRTLTGTFLWDCERFSLTFDVSDTKWKTSVASQRGEYSQRLKSARLTSENGSSSSRHGVPKARPSASSRDFKGAPASRITPEGYNARLDEAVMMSWPEASSGPQDPESRSTGGSQAEPVEETQWPTISSNATTGGHTGLAGGSGTRASLEKMLGRPEALKLNAKLNPRWVETLMGLPIGWTMPSCSAPVTIESMSSACSETAWSRPQPRRPSESCGDAFGVCQTPKAQDSESGKKISGAMNLIGQVRQDWPTIRASDAEHGGPNQRGSKGDLMLPSAVQAFSRTPAVADPGITIERLDGEIGTRMYDKDTGWNCQYGLTQQVQLVERQVHTASLDFL